jgi:hypothetical protein
VTAAITAAIYNSKLKNNKNNTLLIKFFNQGNGEKLSIYTFLYPFISRKLAQ